LVGLDPKNVFSVVGFEFVFEDVPDPVYEPLEGVPVFELPVLELVPPVVGALVFDAAAVPDIKEEKTVSSKGIFLDLSCS
jgi:hypothetical protein